MKSLLETEMAVEQGLLVKHAHTGVLSVAGQSKGNDSVGDGNGPLAIKVQYLIVGMKPKHCG